MQSVDPAVTTQNAFFTMQSMLTLGGATTATFALSNAIQQAFNYNPKWLALAIAEVITLAGAYYSAADGAGYGVAVVNGALIYCTAAGITHMGSSATRDRQTRSTTRAAGPERLRRFLTPWF